MPLVSLLLKKKKERKSYIDTTISSSPYKRRLCAVQPILRGTKAPDSMSGGRDLEVRCSGESQRDTQTNHLEESRASLDGEKALTNTYPDI